MGNFKVPHCLILIIFNIAYPRYGEHPYILAAVFTFGNNFLC